MKAGMMSLLAAGAFLSLGASGCAQAHETAAEAANKKVVLDFYAALNEGDATGTTAQKIQGIAEKYLSPDYTQHAEMYKNLPGAGSDRDKLVRMFQSMPAMKGPVTMPRTEAIMAEGDLVMMLTSRTMPASQGGAGKTNYIFNMFKVKDGKLVEHWDVSPMAGPPPGAGGPGMPGMPSPGAGGPPAGFPPMNGSGPPPGFTPPAGAPPPGQ